MKISIVGLYGKITVESAFYRIIYVSAFKSERTSSGLLETDSAFDLCRDDFIIAGMNETAERMNDLKKVCAKLLCLFFSALLIILNITAFAEKTVEDAPDDEPNANFSAVYGSVLNDYINVYGVISDEHPRGFIAGANNAPNGLIYADMMNFDNSDKPYLVLFLADANAGSLSCHIWTYNDEKNAPKKIAEISQATSDLTSSFGAFTIGWNDEKRYIVYKETRGDKLVCEKYFTVINGEAFQYVNAPDGVSEAAVVGFNSRDIRSDVDISYYNRALSTFFDKLKDSAAASVTYDNVTDKLTDDNMNALESVVSFASELGNFDILQCETMEEYEETLSSQRTGADFYLISDVYSLADEMYYVRFSTNMSFYNYAVCRRTDLDEQYQILRVRMDCIPLSDRELSQVEKELSKSILLYKKAKTGALESDSASQQAKNESRFIKLPKVFSVPKMLNGGIRIPVIYASAALTVLLVTALWVYMYSD